MEDIEAPKVDRKEIEYWSEEEVQASMSNLNSKIILYQSFSL